jgi:methanogenic corrinoid protein MtbC1
MDETLSDYTTVSSSEVQARKAKSKKKKTESKVPPIAKTMESIKRLEEQMKGEELLRKKKYMAGGKVSSSSKYKCSHNSLY